MFKLVQSNQMERLSARLASEINQDMDFCLQPISILVQSPGMASWLKLEIARHNGIAAALEFPLPSNFIWSLCYALLPGVPKENAFTKDAMTWKLMALLPRLQHLPFFEPLNDYLAGGEVLKHYQLAGRIADIFDQYLMYRPDWILAWEQGEDIAPKEPWAGSALFTSTDSNQVDDNCLWQPKLWRALIDYNQQELGLSHWHRANLHGALVSALKDPATVMDALPSRLFVFGISSLPPQTLEVLYALGGRIPVTMLSLSPCRQYWGDILDPRQRARLALRYSQDKMLPAHWEDTLEVGNPLLAANGKMGRELLDLVLSLPEEALEIDDSEYQAPQDNSLLGRLQGDILDMQVAGSPLCATLSRYEQQDGKLALRDDDTSLVLRSCHSPLREVETLHDHLLGMLSDAQGSLSPKDIVVMMPDVAAYAPFIDAVFASKRGEHYIPYAISDRGAAQESPLIHAFLTLLETDDSRFGLTEVLSLVEVPAIMSRFGLDEDELSRLTAWLEDAGVRWGRDSHSREALGLPAFDKHSWAFGIRRMLLGYALGDEADFYQGSLPFSGIEGGQAQCVGKLLDFIELLDTFTLDFQAALTLNDKFALLFSLLSNLFESDENSSDDLNQVREILTNTQRLLAQAGNLDAMPLKVFKTHLASKLSESRVGQRFLAGSVNFCTLMPMRSIPFKLVCLLGMNEGVYPRVQHPVGFDLMARIGARRGDRSRRLDDRYLFLEALLSARSQLYLSFLGRSERDDSERAPSMLVSELLDCCELTAFIPGADMSMEAKLIVQQPLQPFDARLFQPQSAITGSFAAQWCPATQEPPAPFIDMPFINVPDSDGPDFNTLELIDIKKQSGLEAGLDTGFETDLELASLIRFYREPARFFCQRQLRLDLSLRLETLEDSEPFELNPLTRHQVQQQMLDCALDVSARDEALSLETLKQRLSGSAFLPMAPFDALLLKGFNRDIAPLIERSRFMMADSEEQSLNIELRLSHGIRLSGKLERIYAKGLLVTRPGTAKAKDLLALYLRHLCLCAAGQYQYSFLLDMANFHAFAPIAVDDALKRLDGLCVGYLKALSTPSRCIPAMALAATEAFIDGKTDVNSLTQRLADIWEDGQGRGEGSEPHNQRLFRFPADFVSVSLASNSLGDNSFVSEACGLWLPLLSLCHSGKLAELGDFIDAPHTTSPRYTHPAAPVSGQGE